MREAALFSLSFTLWGLVAEKCMPAKYHVLSIMP